MRKRERRMMGSVIGAGRDRLAPVDGYTPTSGPDMVALLMNSSPARDAHRVETAFLFDPPAVNKSRRRGC
jgi:hypothetical protein